MSFRRVINYHRIIEFSWLSEPPLPRAPHFRRRRGKFQAGLVAIKRKNGIDRLRFALVRPRQIRVIIYLTSPVQPQAGRRLGKRAISGRIPVHRDEIERDFILLGCQRYA